MTRANCCVLDASVAVKCLLIEEGSEAARRIVSGRDDWIAPDLIYLEVASVALKSMRRALIDRDQGAAMTANLGALLREVVSSAELADEAFRLGAEHGFSAYDAAYLALADTRGLSLVTADRKLLERARSVGLGHLVDGLDQV